MRVGKQICTELHVGSACQEREELVWLHAQYCGYLVQDRGSGKHNLFPIHQGNCDDCKKKGPNIWACLQVCEGYMNKVLKLVGKLCGRKNGQEQVIKFPAEFDEFDWLFTSLLYTKTMTSTET